MVAKNGKDKVMPTKIKPETKHSIWALVCFALAIFFVVAALNAAGAAGRLTYRLLSHLFGTGYYLFPILVALMGYAFIRSGRLQFFWGRIISGAVFFLGTLTLFSIVFDATTGGLVGRLGARPIVRLFDNYIAVVFLLALDVIALLVIFDTALPWHWFLAFRRLFTFSFPFRRAPALPATSPAMAIQTTNDEADEENDEQEEEAPRPDYSLPKVKNFNELDEPVVATSTFNSYSDDRPFAPPPLDLLERDSGKPAGGDIKAQANIIKRTLANFGIVVEMDEVSIGPSITRYALKPAEGVKLSRIIALQNDLSLALAAHPLRIEAPIPGKSLVGIEIPNTAKTIVGLQTIIGSREFTSSPHPLLVALGRGISGQIITANVAKAPHLLIAGATGSGKSVVIHAFITSLLYRNAPTQLQFIMIDPKRVELTLYKKIPHLRTPVITNAKKAILVLKWAIGEMERRYGILESHSVRDIQSYHQTIYPKAKSGAVERLPYLVIIIDELADIMSAYPRELEAVIVRLAQMSRAVGIHLILSTQRPSVDVITGLIKANVPTRVALQVASQIDSRTILDMAGAEKLLGAGDLLYLSGDMSKPLRLQSAFITESEVKRVVDYVTKQYAGSYDGDQLDLMDSGENGNEANLEETMARMELNDEALDDDPLYEEARAVVVQEGKASATYLQRRLKVGYARAARLLDILEKKGVVGPGEGAKPREIYAGNNESTPNEEPTVN